MSIISALIGSTQGAGGPPPSPTADAYYSGSVSEGNGVNLYISVANWTGARVYWSVVGKGSPAANPSTDMTGTLSGFWDPGAGTYTGNYVGSISFTADSLTEGTEYWGVNLGSTEGGSDYWSGTAWSITDASTTPTGSVVSVGWSHGGGGMQEGVTSNATVTTANIANGTQMYWWKTSGSVSVADFSHETGDNLLSGSLSGQFTINSNQGIFSMAPRADSWTEGTESLQIAFGLNSDQSNPLYYETLSLADNSTLPATMQLINTGGLPTTAVSGAVWPSYDGSGGDTSGIIYGTWTRDAALTTYGGITSGGNSYIEFPTRVTRNTFTIEMVANFTNVGGWQSIWDTGSMNEGGVGYTCFTPGGAQITISTNYGTGSEGSVAFTLGSIYEGLAHWAFVVDFSSGENCKIYRNGTALTKVGSTAVAPLDYGTKPLMISARRGPSFNPTDYARGTIYSVSASTNAYDESTVNYVLNGRRNIYKMTLDGQPQFGYGGAVAVFGTGQFSTSGGYNIVQAGWQAVAVGGTQDGWIGTITAVNSSGAGSLTIASDNAGGLWPTDATSFILRPF